MLRTLSSLLIAAAACTPAPPDPFAELLPPAALAALQDPDRLELMTVVPHAFWDAPPQLQGEVVLGRVEIADPAARRDLTAPLIETLRAGAGQGPTKCFNPRHALRASKGADQVDVIVCFECRDALVMHSGGSRFTALPTKEAEAAFVRETTKAGLRVYGPSDAREPAPAPAPPAAPAP